MILINHEDDLVLLGSLDFEPNDAIAVSITHGDGERLRALSARAGTAASPLVTITTDTPPLAQCLERIRHLMHTNAPLAAVETLYDCVPQQGDFGELLYAVTSAETAHNPTASRELSDFFAQATPLFTPKWDFTSEAAAYCSVAAVAWMPNEEAKEQVEEGGDEVLVADRERQTTRLAVLVDTLLAHGYYAQAQHILEQLLHVDAAHKGALCKLALLQFLQADVETAIASAKGCLADVQGTCRVVCGGSNGCFFLT